MASVSSQKRPTNGEDEALIASLLKIGFDLEKMEDIQHVVIQSDHKTIKSAEENFNKAMHKMIATHKLPFYNLKSPLSDKDFNNLHVFYTILRLFNFTFDMNDLVEMNDSKKVDFEVVSEQLFETMQKVLKEDLNKFNEYRQIVEPIVTEKINSFSVPKIISAQKYFGIKYLIDSVMLSKQISKDFCDSLKIMKQNLLSQFNKHIYSEESKPNFLGLLLTLASAFSKFDYVAAMELVLIIFFSFTKSDSAMLIDLTNLLLHTSKNVPFDDFSLHFDNVYFSILNDFEINEANAIQISSFISNLFHLFAENKFLKEKHVFSLFTLYKCISDLSIDINKKVICAQLIFNGVRFSSTIPRRNFVVPLFNEANQNFINEFSFVFNSSSFESIFNESGNAVTLMSSLNTFIGTVCGVLKDLLAFEKKTKKIENCCLFTSQDFCTTTKVFVHLFEKLHEGCISITNLSRKIDYLSAPETVEKYFELTAENTEILYNIRMYRNIAAKSCKCICSLLENSPSNFRRVVLKKFADSLLSFESIDKVILQQIYDFNFLPFIIERLSKHVLDIKLMKNTLGILSEIFKNCESKEDKISFVKPLHTLVDNIIAMYQSYCLQINIFDVLKQIFEFGFACGAKTEDFINTKFTDGFFLFDDISAPKTKEFFNFLKYLIKKNPKITDSDLFMESFIPFMSSNFDESLKILSKTSFANDFFANRKCFMKITNIIYNCLAKASVESRLIGVQVLKTLLPSQFNQLHVTTININNETSLSLVGKDFTAWTDTEEFIDAIIKASNEDPTPFVFNIFTRTMIELFPHSLTKRAHFIAHKAVNKLIAMDENNAIINQILESVENKDFFIAHVLFSIIMTGNSSEIYSVCINEIVDYKSFCNVIKCLFILFQFYPHHNGVAATKIISTIIRNVRKEAINAQFLIEYVNELVIHHTKIEIPVTKGDENLSELNCFNKEVKELIEDCRAITYELENNNEQLEMLKLNKAMQSRIFITSLINSDKTDVSKACFDLMKRGNYELAGLLLRISPKTKESLYNEIKEYIKHLIINDSDAISFYIAALDIVNDDELIKLCNSAAKQLRSEDIVKQTQASIFFEKCSKMNQKIVKDATISIFEKCIRPYPIRETFKNVLQFFRFLPNFVFEYLIDLFKKEIESLDSEGNENETRKNIDTIIKCLLETDIFVFIKNNGKMGSLINNLIFCYLNHPSKCLLIRETLQKEANIISIFIENLSNTKVSLPLFELIERNNVFQERINIITDRLESNIEKGKVTEKTVLSLILYTYCSGTVGKHNLDTRIREILPSVVKIFAKLLPTLTGNDFKKLLKFYFSKFYIDVVDLFDPIYETGSLLMMKQFANIVKKITFTSGIVFEHIKEIEIKHFTQFSKLLTNTYINNQCPYSYDTYIMTFGKKLKYFSEKPKSELPAKVQPFFNKIHPYIEDEELKSLSMITKDNLSAFQTAYHRLAKYPNLVYHLLLTIPPEDKCTNEMLIGINSVIENLLVFLKGIERPAQLRGYFDVIELIFELMKTRPELFVKMPIKKYGDFISKILCIMVKGYFHCQEVYQDIDVFKFLVFLVENHCQVNSLIRETFRVLRKIVEKKKDNQKALKIVLKAIKYITSQPKARVPAEVLTILCNFAVETTGVNWSYALWGLICFIKDDKEQIQKASEVFYKNNVIYRIFPALVSVNKDSNAESLANFAIAYSKMREILVSFDAVYFIELILQIESANNFHILSKELNKAKSDLTLNESKRFIFNFFAAIFKLGIDNKSLKGLVDEAFAMPDVIRIFEDHPSLAHLIFQNVSPISQVRMSTTIFIPNIGKISPTVILENSERFNLSTSIVTGLFSKEKNFANIAPLLRSPLSFEIKRNHKVKDNNEVLIKAKNGFRSTYSSTLSLYPLIPSTQLEVIAEKSAIIPISSMAMMLGLNKVAISQMPVDQKKVLSSFPDNVCKSLENIFANTDSEGRATVAKTIDATLSTKSTEREFAIRASLADEFKHALLGNAMFHYILPHSASPSIHVIYKKLRSLVQETPDEQLESFHENSFKHSEFLFNEEKREILVTSDDQITPENISKIAVFTSCFDSFKENKHKIERTIHSALRIHATSDVLLSLLLYLNIDPLQRVPFSWSPLFLNNNASLISPAYFLALKDESIPTDARPFIDEFKAFINSFFESPIITELKDRDENDYSQSNEFRKSMAKGISFISKRSPSTRRENFIRAAPFTELRAPLIEEDVKSMSAVATIDSHRSNNINIAMRLSNGTLVNYLFLFRKSFDPRYFIFSHIVTKMLHRSPISSSRSMIIQTPHFCTLENGTLVRTNGFPLIEEVRLFKPYRQSTRTHGTPDFFSTREKCIWQSISTARLSAISVLQVIMSSPVPNPYDIIVDFSSCSFSIAMMKQAAENEIPYIFPRLTGGIARYTSFTKGQLIVNMKAAAVSLNTFLPKLSFFSKTVMEYDSKDALKLSHTLKSLADMSRNGYDKGQEQIKALIESGSSKETLFAIPWI